MNLTLLWNVGQSDYSMSQSITTSIHMTLHNNIIVLYKPQCVGTQMNYNSTTAMHQDDPTTGATHQPVSQLVKVMVDAQSSLGYQTVR